MIEQRPVMTLRESVHQIIDALPEDRLADVLDYLEDLQDNPQPLSAETQAAIAEGLEDIRNGRTITLAEYRRARGL